MARPLSIQIAAIFWHDPSCWCVSVHTLSALGSRAGCVFVAA